MYTSHKPASATAGLPQFITVACRRKQNLISLSCFLVIFFILFMNIGFSTRAKHVNVYNEKQVPKEIRHVHECHCLVTVALPANMMKINDVEKGNSITDTKPSAPTKTYALQKKDQDYQHKDVNTMIESKQESPGQRNNTVANRTSTSKFTKSTINIKEKKAVESFYHPRARIPDNILHSITLKPNFTRLINASQIVLTVNTSYILENPTLCSSVRNLNIIVIVHTSPDHKERRLSIRNTWANDAFYHHLGNVRTVFLLGKSKDQNIQNQIKEEFKRYGDLLQGDFIDDYHNLTLKGVMAYKWLTERCRNAELVLKVDDDISVDMFKMFNVYFPKYRLENMTIICNHILEKTMGILRKNDSKWYVSNDHFRGLGAYPTDYCSGFLVLFTNDLIPALYQSSKVTPFFWVDDVYLYGLVPGNVPGVKYIGLKGNWHQLGGQVAIKCYKNETETCPFLVAGAGAKGEFEELWPHMVKRYAVSTKVIDLDTK